MAAGLSFGTAEHVVMNQTLKLPGDVYRKFAQGAAERGMTVESLLEAISDLVVVPEQATEQNRNRSARIERLLNRLQAGQANAGDRAELDRLIDADYQAATERADRLISAKGRGPRNGRAVAKRA
jgi:hypothetical protein